MSLPSRTAAAVALCAAVFAISWASILVRLCHAPSLAIAFWRVLFATAILLPWGVTARRPASWRTAALAAAAGALLALHFAAWIHSLALTSVASSVVLVTTQPVFTAAFGPLLLGERPGPLGLSAAALALAGTAVLAGGDLAVGGKALLGDLLALTGAATAAAYFMIGRRVRERIDFVAYLVLVNGSAAAVLLLLALAAGAPLRGFPATTWWLLVLMAIGPHVTGHGLLNWSVRRLRAFTVNMAVLGEPVLATIYAAALFGERPGGAFLAGAAMIACGLVLAAREEARRGGYNPPGAGAAA